MNIDSCWSLPPKHASVPFPPRPRQQLCPRDGVEAGQHHHVPAVSPKTPNSSPKVHMLQSKAGRGGLRPSLGMRLLGLGWDVWQEMDLGVRVKSWLCPSQLSPPMDVYPSDLSLTWAEQEPLPIPCSPATLPRVTASSKNKQITASLRDAGGLEGKPSVSTRHRGDEGGRRGRALARGHRAAPQQQGGSRCRMQTPRDAPVTAPAGRWLGAGTWLSTWRGTWGPAAA